MGETNKRPRRPAETVVTAAAPAQVVRFCPHTLLHRCLHVCREATAPAALPDDWKLAPHIGTETRVTYAVCAFGEVHAVSIPLSPQLHKALL